MKWLLDLNWNLIMRRGRLNFMPYVTVLKITCYSSNMQLQNSNQCNQGIFQDMKTHYEAEMIKKLILVIWWANFIFYVTCNSNVQLRKASITWHSLWSDITSPFVIFLNFIQYALIYSFAFLKILLQLIKQFCVIQFLQLLLIAILNFISYNLQFAVSFSLGHGISLEIQIKNPFNFILYDGFEIVVPQNSSFIQV